MYLSVFLYCMFFIFFSLCVSLTDNMLLASELAMGTGVITSCLFQVPNEKMVFSSDPTQKSRGEDAIIAFTWDHFLNNPEDSEWLVRLPMVKASVRAMDATSTSIIHIHTYTAYWPTSEFIFLEYY